MPFDVIVVDPPWKFYGDPNKDQAAGKHYQCMPLEEIKALEISKALAPNGVVFLWTTSAHMESAIECIRAWGLTYRGVAFVWVKTRKDGTVIGAQGVRPSITKPTTEFVLAASRVKKGRPLPVCDESVPQVVLAPRGEHSEKPEEVYDRIERLYTPRIRLNRKKLVAYRFLSFADMFARREREGWHCFGDGIDGRKLQDVLAEL